MQNNINKIDEFILSGLKEKSFENMQATFHLPDRELKSTIKNLPELAKSMKELNAAIATIILPSKQKLIVTCEKVYNSKSARQFVFAKVDEAQEDQDFESFYETNS